MKVKRKLWSGLLKTCLGIVFRWYIWLSVILVYLFESPPKLAIKQNFIFQFFTNHPLLAVLLAFLFWFIVLPNNVLFHVANRFFPPAVTKKNYPKRYFDTMLTANNVLLALVGITFGLFKFSPGQIGVAESRTIVLLFVSGFSGLVAIISQITPTLQENTGGHITAFPLTKHIMFVATYFQVVLLILSLYEAYISLLTK
jgi:hypothetical protein